MPDPLSALIDERSALLRQFAELGDFQPGSISNPTLRCGKPSCHCARPDDPGHGPYYHLTRKIEGKTVTDDLVGVNRKICRLRPVEPTGQTEQEKKRPRRSTKKSPAK